MSLAHVISGSGSCSIWQIAKDRKHRYNDEHKDTAKLKVIVLVLYKSQNDNYRFTFRSVIIAWIDENFESKKSIQNQKPHAQLHPGRASSACMCAIVSESPCARGFIILFSFIFVIVVFHVSQAVIIASFALLCSMVEPLDLLRCLCARSRFDDSNQLFTFLMLTDSKIVLIYLIMVIIIIIASTPSMVEPETGRHTNNRTFNAQSRNEMHSWKPQFTGVSERRANSQSDWHIVRVHGFLYLFVFERWN